MTDMQDDIEESEQRDTGGARIVRERRPIAHRKLYLNRISAHKHTSSYFTRPDTHVFQKTCFEAFVRRVLLRKAKTPDGSSRPMKLSRKVTPRLMVLVQNRLIDLLVSSNVVTCTGNAVTVNAKSVAAVRTIRNVPWDQAPHSRALRLEDDGAVTRSQVQVPMWFHEEQLQKIKRRHERRKKAKRRRGSGAAARGRAPVKTPAKRRRKAPAAKTTTPPPPPLAPVQPLTHEEQALESSDTDEQEQMPAPPSSDSEDDDDDDGEDAAVVQQWSEDESDVPPRSDDEGHSSLDDESFDALLGSDDDDE